MCVCRICGERILVEFRIVQLGTEYLSYLWEPNTCGISNSAVELSYLWEPNTCGISNSAGE